MVDNAQKSRVQGLASAVLDGLNAVGDGDATEALAGLYAAVQVLERELLGRGHLAPDQVLHIQLVGRRLGAAMTVTVDEEVLDEVPGEEETVN